MSVGGNLNLGMSNSGICRCFLGRTTGGTHITG